MNILNIGTDKTLVGGKRLGDAIERHRKYGEAVDHLDIIVYTDKKEDLKEFFISDKVIGYPTNSCCKPWFIFDAVKIFKQINNKHKIDLVQCQDPFLPGLVGWWLKRKFGVKLQINFHGDFWDNLSWLKERKINRIFLWISKFTVPRADAIRVMSEGQKDKLIRAGINEKKIRVISTPVDIDKFKVESENSKAENDKKIILHIGRDDEVKDYNTLVNAFRLVKEKIPDTKFVQAGADNELYQAMDNINFKDILLKGRLNHDSLMDLYNQSFVFVLSSTSESFGKVLVEANACGKPVVSTATTGAKEIIEDGKNGFLVGVGDYQALAEKIIYLLEHPIEAKAMGERGRQMVKERFGDNTSKIVKFWQDIIGGNL